ncbi:MAG: glycerophosphodiester phosphodiesterase, partial [Gemmatimonadales bacterium]
MGSTLFSTTGNPVIIGHRGAAGYAPANSLEALRKAATGDGPARSDAVEIDLRVTSDGELVVIHDAHLTDGSEVVALPASRVRAISTRLGEPVSTLIEALDAAPGVVICVEVKALPPGRDDALLQALESVPRARRHIHAFDHRIIARLHA